MWKGFGKIIGDFGEYVCKERKTEKNEELSIMGWRRSREIIQDPGHFKMKCNFGTRTTRHTWDRNMFSKMLTKVFQPFRSCGYEWPSQAGVSASFKLALKWFYGETLGLHTFRKGYMG